MILFQTAVPIGSHSDVKKEQPFKPAAAEPERCVPPAMSFSVGWVLTQAALTTRADLRRLRLVPTPMGAEEIKPVSAIRTLNGMGVFAPHRAFSGVHMRPESIAGV